MRRIFCISGLALAVGWVAQPAFAETPNEILASFQKEASGAPGFQGFSVARGESFFKDRHGNEWSCASCHTENPSAQGKHAKTGKPIDPLSPAANPERFSNQEKVDKWARRNCKDVLGRACTPQEKGDVLAYLLTVKK